MTKSIRFTNESAFQDKLLRRKNSQGKTLIEEKILTSALKDGDVVQNLNLYKEFNLAGCGNVDILAFHKTIREKDISNLYDLHILELKINDITMRHIGQVLRYHNYIENCIKIVKSRLGMKKCKLRIHCHVIGPFSRWRETDDYWAVLYLQEKISLHIHEFDIDIINGIDFFSSSKCDHQTPNNFKNVDMLIAYADGKIPFKEVNQLREEENNDNNSIENSNLRIPFSNPLKIYSQTEEKKEKQLKKIL